MTLSDYIAFSETRRRVAMNEDWPTSLSAEKNDSSGYVEFSDILIMHKFAGRVTSQTNFKGTPLFNIEYLGNDTK